MFAWLCSHDCQMWLHVLKSFFCVSKFLFHVHCFSSVLLWLCLEKGQQVVCVLCYKGWGCRNWENTCPQFLIFRCTVVEEKHLPYVKIECASLKPLLRKSWRWSEVTNCLFAGRVPLARTWLHYVGEEQVNILWATVTPIPVCTCVHARTHTHTAYTSMHMTKHTLNVLEQEKRLIHWPEKDFPFFLLWELHVFYIAHQWITGTDTMCVYVPAVLEYGAERSH